MYGPGFLHFYFESTLHPCDCFMFIMCFKFAKIECYVLGNEVWFFATGLITKEEVS
jgi:hypothetical protein